jgi:two-component system nitrate/nitrite sensor histidine kinase NarX
MGTMLMALVTLALATLLSSYFVIEEADKDAEAVNLAGSLRMTTYQLLAFRLVSGTPDTDAVLKTDRLIRQFEERIHQTALLMAVRESPSSELNKQWENVHNRWLLEVKPVFQMPSALPVQSPLELTARIDSFVDQVDELVRQYQLKAESRIENLRVIQISAMFLTLLLVTGSLLILHHRVEVPLRKLTEAARRIGKGDFSQPVDIDNQDELDVLAETINQMSSDLNQMYSTLEARVAIKTKALAKSADVLNFLYHIARDVSEHNRDTIDFDHWLQELAKITGIEDMDLCLKTPRSVIPYVSLHTEQQSPGRERCHQIACDTCMNQDVRFADQSAGDVTGVEKPPTLYYPVIREGVQYGVLVCGISDCEAMAEWQYQLLQSFTDQVAIACSLQNQEDQDRRASLLNERSVIARELHDSLAQALSYLKIQVTRLKRSLQKQAVSSPELDEITEELKEGIGSAYRQLRELLTTFRLSISAEGLKAALSQAVDQFSRLHPELTISLDCQIDRIPLTPNEEIHVLQLTREALQNAVRHAGGSHVMLWLHETAHNQITVRVMDDGKGLAGDPQRANHYGIAIMRERARHLGGTLDFINRQEGGTEVSFTFTPQAVSDTSQTVADKTVEPLTVSVAPGDH